MVLILNDILCRPVVSFDANNIDDDAAAAAAYLAYLHAEQSLVDSDDDDQDDDDQVDFVAHTSPVVVRAPLQYSADDEFVSGEEFMATMHEEETLTPCPSRRISYSPRDESAACRPSIMPSVVATLMLMVQDPDTTTAPPSSPASVDRSKQQEDADCPPSPSVSPLVLASSGDDTLLHLNSKPMLHRRSASTPPAAIRVKIRQPRVARRRSEPALCMHHQRQQQQTQTKAKVSLKSLATPMGAMLHRVASFTKSVVKEVSSPGYLRDTLESMGDKFDKVKERALDSFKPKREFDEDQWYVHVCRRREDDYDRKHPNASQFFRPTMDFYTGKFRDWKSPSIDGALAQPPAM